MSKRCKYCQTEIDDRATVCPYCQKKQNGCCSGCLNLIGGIFFLFIIATIIDGVVGSCAIDRKNSPYSPHPTLQSHDSYEHIARSNEGTTIECTGKIAQIIYSSQNGEVQGRLDLAPDFEKDIYFFYTYNDGESRLLEDDIVTLTGTVTTPVTSERAIEWSRKLFGETRTIPGIKVDSMQRNGRALSYK